MNQKSAVRFLAILLVVLFLVACSGTSSAPSAAAPTRPPIAVGFTPASVCLVPNIVGLDQGRAEEILIEVGLQPVKKYQEDPSVAKDALISQDPTADTRLSPCTGDVIMVVSLGGPSIPTETPAPPTLTPTVTPVPPTSTFTPVPPTATVTPDPRLFWDDFENGIKPDWNISGSGQALTVNGRLNVDGGVNAIVGSTEWRNYAVEMDFYQMRASWIDYGGIRVVVRIQENGDYIAAKLDCGCVRWIVNINGQDTNLPNASTCGLNWCDGGHLRIEVENDNFSTFENGNRRMSVNYPGLGQGRVGIINNYGTSTLDNFQIISLP